MLVPGAATAAPANDDLESATEIASIPFSESIDTAGSTVEPAEPAPCGNVAATVWYRYAAPAGAMLRATTSGSDYDTALAVYTGTGIGDLTLVACADDDGELQTETIDFDASSGTVYWVQAGGFDGATGSLAFGFGLAPLPPPNDDRASATEIAALPFTGSADTTLATLEASEPQPCASIGRTVWYRFAAGSGAYVAAETAGSGFDTALAVYAGGAPSASTLIECSDNLPSSLSSRVAFRAVAGQTYWIQAGGAFAAAGALAISLASTSAGPSNDDVASALGVAALPFTQTLSTAAATLEAGEPAPCGTVSATVWYRWTAPSGAPMTAHTFGSGFDTVLAVYHGSPGALALAGCNDDAQGGARSRVDFDATAGVTYYFQAGGTAGVSGALSFTLLARPANDDRSGATAIAALPYTHTLATADATTQPSEPEGCGGIARTVWYRYTPPSASTLVADVIQSNFPARITVYRQAGSALVEVGCSADRAGPFSQARVQFDAVAGTTYWFQASGEPGGAEHGTLAFHLRAPRTQSRAYVGGSGDLGLCGDSACRTLQEAGCGLTAACFPIADYEARIDVRVADALGGRVGAHWYVLDLLGRVAFQGAFCERLDDLAIPHDYALSYPTLVVTVEEAWGPLHCGTSGRGAGTWGNVVATFR